eukprot:gnl/TRDRNA2_/TRDRNA2_29881_c0_seq1.p1 gnl/TRDRNA2_/TRDRNA2_29881_c0~~gnl/TRDRNA2_/TRDRNA2_29881_c0_seq1.p1  ORF type:complete len:229 (+),score=50.73 gnl/TRDRNA2_/TRDRNA2_29881_c0_seq1:106-792(+)
MATEQQKAEMKLRKKLREIEKIEARISAGEQLDVLQRKKVEGKAEVLAELEGLAAGVCKVAEGLHGQAAAPRQTAKSCTQCGRVGGDGAVGGAGTQYAGKWFCSACWNSWTDGTAQPFSGAGQRLGGEASRGSLGNLTAQERQRRVLEAAEARQNRAPGLSDGQLSTLAERRQRDELVGRITELHRREGRDAPIGLGAATLTQLREQLDRLRGRSKDGDVSEQVLQDG